jgi:hypothetical protein
MTLEAVSAGGAGYNSLGLFVGPVDHTDVVRVDVSALTTAEVDADGYLKPGVPFKSDGTLCARRPGQYTKVAAGGAAAAQLTVTGIATTDQLTGVILHVNSGSASLIRVSDLTSEFTIPAANKIVNTGSGTVTTGESLLVTYETTAEYVFGVVMEPVKVAAANDGTSLSAATDIDVAVARVGVINRDAAEDNLGRAYTAIELAAFAAKGSHLAVTLT